MYRLEINWEDEPRCWQTITEHEQLDAAQKHKTVSEEINVSERIDAELNGRRHVEKAFRIINTKTMETIDV